MLKGVSVATPRSSQLVSSAHLFLCRACKRVLGFALPVSVQEAVSPLLRFSPPGQPVCPARPQGSLALLHSLQPADIHVMVQLGNCCALCFCSCRLHLCKAVRAGGALTLIALHTIQKDGHRRVKQWPFCTFQQHMCGVGGNTCKESRRFLSNCCKFDYHPSNVVSMHK